MNDVENIYRSTDDDVFQSIAVTDVQKCANTFFLNSVRKNLK